MLSNIKRRGVVILFAVLVVSVVLTISLGLFNITYRQLVLSSIARESEIAFFVADSARNCAIYWNSPDRYAFGEYTIDRDTFDATLGSNSATLDCGEVSNIPTGCVGETDGGRKCEFNLNFNIGSGAESRLACAEVQVVKKPPADKGTVITVNGYNISGSGGACPPTNLNRAVQRTIIAESGD